MGSAAAEAEAEAAAAAAALLLSLPPTLPSTALVAAASSGKAMSPIAADAAARTLTVTLWNQNGAVSLWGG